MEKVSEVLEEKEVVANLVDLLSEEQVNTNEQDLYEASVDR